MSFFGNLIKAPFKGIGDIVKGAAQTLISPLKAAWDGVKTIASVGKDFLTLKWNKIPGDVAHGAINMVKDVGEGPLNMLRGTVGLGAMVGGTALGTAVGGPLGGAAAYAATAQFANWVE